MTVLLVQSCSKSKNQDARGCQPLELYDGYFFKIVKKAKREGALRDDLEICILSAKYGLVDQTDSIDHYDREMTGERARQLRPEVLANLESRVAAHDYETVLLNLGRTYRSAVEGLSERVDTPVTTIEGGGIGEKGQQLKQLLRTDCTVTPNHI